MANNLEEWHELYRNDPNQARYEREAKQILNGSKPFDVATCENAIIDYIVIESMGKKGVDLEGLTMDQLKELRKDVSAQRRP